MRPLHGPVVTAPHSGAPWLRAHPDRSTRGPLAATAFVCALAASTAAHAATAPVMLLASSGTAKEDARRGVDGSLRSALLDEDSVDVMSGPETREHVMALAEEGLVCVSGESKYVECLVKLGIAANVAYVVAPLANAIKGDKELDVQIDVVDVQKGKLARTVKAHFAPDDETKATDAVRKALGLNPKAPPNAQTSTQTSTSSQTSSNTPHVDDPPPNPPPSSQAGQTPPVGAIVAGVSGGVAALALVGAVACDVVYSDTFGKIADAKTRKDVVQPAGAALWVTTTLGLVGAGVGVALLLTQAPAEGAVTP